MVVPVTDADRARSFYADKLGFNVDHDHSAGEMGVAQLTRPGRPARSPSALIRSRHMALGHPGQCVAFNQVGEIVTKALSER